MSARHDRTMVETPPTGQAERVATAAHRDDVSPVAVSGLATGIRRRSVDDDPLGGTVVAPEIDTALRRRQGGGRPLEPEHAERMSAALGVDLGGVRIHDDGEADTIARSVQATAFTAGSDVYFTRGTYAPGTSGGDHLLAHELAHVAQGGSGGGSAQEPVIGAADDPAEAAADAMADSAVSRLQRQTARVAGTASSVAPAEPVQAIAPLRRQAERAGTVRRWNPFKALLGGKKKKAKKKLSTKTPVPSPVTAKVTTPVEPKVPVPSITTIPKPVTTPVTEPVTTPVTTPTVPEPVVTTVDEPVAEVTTVDTATVEETAPETGTPTDATPTTDVVAPTTTTEPVVATPEVVTPPAQKPAKERFEAACDPQTAPANKGVAKTRMDALRVIINGFSGAEKQAISTDPEAMAKGRVHLGDLYYMSLLAAVDTNVKKTDKVDPSKKTKHHLTGAEADEFIRTNIEDYPHLKPFVEAAVGAGKKGEGYVASISPEDWAIVYGVEFPTDSEAEQKSTNAYASTKNEDGPAILHADRGTPSTAIHESMHRYAPDDVLNTYGFDLNEGITEYFTRVLTDQNAAPAKNGGPERTNYPKQVAFVRDMIYILGGSKTDQETVLAQIYFEGKLTLLETRFKAAHVAKTPTMTDAEQGTAWTSFVSWVKKGDWTKAKAKLPAK